jgi:1-acyl-sn-glycerol-3-phosphate acyltransferase
MSTTTHRAALLSDRLGWTLARRGISLTARVVVAVLVLPLLPVWLLLTSVVDLLRDTRVRPLRLSFSRALLLFVCYLVAEIVGVTVGVTIWAASGAWLPRVSQRLRARGQQRCRSWSYQLQCQWISALMMALRRLHRLRLEVEGDALARPGPLIVFFRHSSIGDILLPGYLLPARHGSRLRYVLKRTLLWDPCLDLVGNRLPNVFVRRGGTDAEHEVTAVAALAENLDEDDGVLIYPEGTRYTEAKRARALARFAAEGDTRRHQLQSRLRHTRLPRPGGPQALLAACRRGDAAPDVLIGGLVGLEVATSLGPLIQGALLGQTVRVRFWRFPAAEVPDDAEARELWLAERWLAVDAFVADALATHATAVCASEQTTT